MWICEFDHWLVVERVASKRFAGKSGKEVKILFPRDCWCFSTLCRPTAGYTQHKMCPLENQMQRVVFYVPATPVNNTHNVEIHNPDSNDSIGLRHGPHHDCRAPRPLPLRLQNLPPSGPFTMLPTRPHLSKSTLQREMAPTKTHSKVLWCAR